MKKKKRKPIESSKSIIAIMPWTTDVNGNKTIDLGNGDFITPETEIVIAKNMMFGNNMVVAKDANLVFNNDGLIFYGKTDQEISEELKINIADNTDDKDIL